MCSPESSIYYLNLLVYFLEFDAGAPQSYGFGLSKKYLNFPLLDPFFSGVLYMAASEDGPPLETFLGRLYPTLLSFCSR